MALALTAEQRIDAPPTSVFALFGAGSGAGWVFDAACDQVIVGAAVTMRAPLGGPTGLPVEVLGRIARVRAPGSCGGRIEIQLHLPWRGRLRLHLDAAGTGTRVRLIAELDDEGLQWLMRRRGHPMGDEPHGDDHRVGLLTSKSGPGSIFTMATESLAMMAVEEINADGGILGRPVRLVVGDDGTNPVLGSVEARRLVRSGCRTILACTTSATFARVSHTLAADGVLLVHTLMNEGGMGSELRVQLGERPDDQLRAATGPMMREAGGRRWFLAGNDYVWPRAVHAAARRVVHEQGGRVVGEAFAPLGTGDFAPIIGAVLASGADVVLSSFVGADLVAFERQCHAMGVRDRARTLALALDEPTRERVGDAAGAGMWGVSGYFEQLPDVANVAFLDRYRKAFGPFAPSVSSISESVYEALHLYAAAARRAGEDEPRSVARHLRCSRSEFPRGTVTIDGPETVSQRLFLAQATTGGFTVSPTLQRATPH